MTISVEDRQILRKICLPIFQPILDKMLISAQQRANSGEGTDFDGFASGGGRLQEEYEHAWIQIKEKIPIYRQTAKLLDQINAEDTDLNKAICDEIDSFIYDYLDDSDYHFGAVMGVSHFIDSDYDNGNHSIEFFIKPSKIKGE